MTTKSLTSDLIARAADRSTDRSERVHDNDNRAARAGSAGPDMGLKGRRRRSLVLTDERARHPFRASLPPHVARDLHDIPAESLWALTRDDVRGFASVYLAATAGILAFIA